MPLSPDSASLHGLVKTLYSAYGSQHWWPGDSRFEVMTGAILTQNTAWRNVERALAALKTARVLSPAAMGALPPRQLAELIRPAGCFNIKAQRLGNLCRFILQEGGMACLATRDSESLRQALLSINGIGPETADSILLYAFDRPMFVIDAYTRRIFRRLGMIGGDEPYEVLRTLVERGLEENSRLYNELHALLVRHAKECCKSRTPVCIDCCLSSECSFYRAVDQ